MPVPRAHPHRVVLGGGYAGLDAARSLACAPLRITLIDRRNHHQFQPLPHPVATGGLSSPDIAAPLRHILHHMAASWITTCGWWPAAPSMPVSATRSGPPMRPD